MKKNNIILIILCYLFLSVLVDYSANAQTNKPTIVFQIDNEIIGDDSFVVEIKKNSLFKSKLVLKSTQKTIKVNNDVQNSVAIKGEDCMMVDFPLFQIGYADDKFSTN